MGSLLSAVTAMETVKGVVIDVSGPDLTVATVGRSNNRIPACVRLTQPEGADLDLASWVLLQSDSHGVYGLKEVITEPHRHPCIAIVKKGTVRLSVKLDIKENTVSGSPNFGYSPVIGNVFMGPAAKLDKLRVYDGSVSWAPKHIRESLNLNWMLMDDPIATDEGDDELLYRSEVSKRSPDPERVPLPVDAGNRRSESVATNGEHDRPTEEMQSPYEDCREARRVSVDPHRSSTDSINIPRHQYISQEWDDMWGSLFLVMSDDGVMSECRAFDGDVLVELMDVLLAMPQHQMH